MTDPGRDVSVDEHRARILGAVSPVPSMECTLHDALGLTLARPLIARIAVPGFDNSAMDGYAVRLDDVRSVTRDSPVCLTVIADIPAGSAANPKLQPGQTARIMTGAPIPDASDFVVPLEHTDSGTATVTVTTLTPGRNHIRAAGADARVGDTVLAAGSRLDSRGIAAAAAVGFDRVTVTRRLRVAVISTGSELSAPAQRLERGKIHDSNSWFLASAVRELGAEPIPIRAVEDDPESFRLVLDGISGTVDAVITSGGVGPGAWDVVRGVLEPVPSMWFGAVRLQPGRPQGFGYWRDGTPIFALPGNPVGVVVSFELFVAPALRRMQGDPHPVKPSRWAVASVGWPSPRDRLQGMPVSISTDATGALGVRPSGPGGSGSHLVASLARANGLALVPEQVTVVAAGDDTEVVLFR